MPKTTCKSEAERLLAELQQSVATFKFRGKTHPSKSLQQILLEAEAAYERCAYDLVSHLAQVGNRLVERDRELLDALFFGMENSIHAREDPTDPNSPKSIGAFMAHCADENPVAYVQLLKKLLASKE